MLKDVRREAEHACRVWTALKYCRSPANNVVGRILEGFVFEGSGLSYSYLITNPNTISYHNNLSLTMFGMDHYSLCVLLRDRFLFRAYTRGVSTTQPSACPEEAGKRRPTFWSTTRISYERSQRYGKQTPTTTAATAARTMTASFHIV